MKQELGQSAFEDLSAYLDGELPPERAEQVRRVLTADQTWRQAKRDLEALDSALDLWTAPPAPEGLAARIARNVRRAGRRTPLPVRLVRLAAPLAVAAAVLVAVIATFRAPPAPRTGGDQTNAIATNDDTGWTNVVAISRRPRELSDQDRRIADKTIKDNLQILGLFRDFDVVENFETLDAIGRIENGT